MKINWSNVLSGGGTILLFAGLGGTIGTAMIWGVLTMLPGIPALTLLVAIGGALVALLIVVVMAPRVHEVEPFFERDEAGTASSRRSSGDSHHEKTD